MQLKSIQIRMVLDKKIFHFRCFNLQNINIQYQYQPHKNKHLLYR